MENMKWCPVAGKHALDGMTYVLTVPADIYQETGMCVEWPECRKCASGEGCRCQRDLLEGGAS